jgi:hypothetical protein
MEKRVAGVLHDARRHGADILLDTGRALRLGGLVNGKKVSLRRAGYCWRIREQGERTLEMSDKLQPKSADKDLG